MLWIKIPLSEYIELLEEQVTSLSQQYCGVETEETIKARHLIDECKMIKQFGQFTNDELAKRIYFASE